MFISSSFRGFTITGDSAGFITEPFAHHEVLRCSMLDVLSRAANKPLEGLVRFAGHLHRHLLQINRIPSEQQQDPLDSQDSGEQFL